MLRCCDPRPRQLCPPGHASGGSSITQYWYSVLLFAFSTLFFGGEKVFEESVFQKYRVDVILMLTWTMWTQTMLGQCWCREHLNAPRRQTGSRECAYRLAALPTAAHRLLLPIPSVGVWHSRNSVAIDTPSATWARRTQRQVCCSRNRVVCIPC